MFKSIAFSLIVIFVVASNAAVLTVSVHDNPLCPLCLETLNTTITYLKQNKTKNEILHTIEIGLCLGLGPLALPCYEFVKKEGPKIIDELANNTNPLAVCQGIKLCDSNSTKIAIKKDIKQTDSKRVPRIGNSTFCTLCQVFVNQTGAMLKQNKTKQQILHTLELICLPLGGLALPCYELIKREGPRLIDLVANNTNATVVCQEIKLCDSLIAEKVNLYLESCSACLKIFAYENKKSIGLIREIFCSISIDKSSCYQTFEYNDPQIICKNIEMCQ